MRQKECHGAKILVDYLIHKNGTFDLLEVWDKSNLMGPKYWPILFFIGRVLLTY